MVKPSDAKKKILILCPYPENKVPAQRLKYEQYFSYLNQNGYEIHVKQFFSDKAFSILYTKGNYFKKILGVLSGYIRRFFLIFQLHKYDGVYIFLHVTPLGPPIFEFLYSLFIKRYIYDIDDLVFLGKTSAFNTVTRFLRGKLKYTFLMKHASHVITCTPYLDEYVRQYNQNTTDISSTIRTDDYRPINTYSNDKPITLGWSGSHSTAPYLKILHPVLLELQKKYGCEIFVIGDKNFTLPGLKLSAIAWNEPSEVEDLQKIDIGLYPLPDEQWVLGKSGLKALQYMALGIPTVATAIGANFRVIEDGVSGFLVKTEAEWFKRLEALILDAALRKKLGTAARERVENLYSVRANAPKYLKAFEAVYGSASCAHEAKAHIRV